MITERFIRRFAVLSVIVLCLSISVGLLLLEPMTLREIYNALIKIIGVAFFIAALYLLKTLFNRR